MWIQTWSNRGWWLIYAGCKRKFFDDIFGSAVAAMLVGANYVQKEWEIFFSWLISLCHMKHYTKKFFSINSLSHVKYFRYLSSKGGSFCHQSSWKFNVCARKCGKLGKFKINIFHTTIIILWRTFACHNIVYCAC